MSGGRLHLCGKSKRSKAPADGHLSDSSGKLYAFPTQRSSDSGLEALRLSRPPGLWSAKIFSHRCRCPPLTHVSGAEPVSGFHGISNGEVVWRRYVPGYIEYEIMDGFMQANDGFSDLAWFVFQILPCFFVIGLL